MVDRRQAQTWRDGVKTCIDPGPAPVWQATGVPGRSLLIANVVYGEDRRMQVLAEERGPSTTQIRLTAPDGTGNLARLCRCPRHGNDVHWHWFEDMGDDVDEVRESVPAIGQNPTRDEMLSLFAERLKIQGLKWQEELG